MNFVSGNVRIENTTTGISQLQIVAYHVPEFVSKTEGDQDANPADVIKTRLGSTTTDTNGFFTIEYDLDELNCSTDGKRANLWLEVLGPEHGNSRECAAVLYRACEVRWAAGYKEYYLVQLDRRSLEQSGALVPPAVVSNPQPAAVIESLVGRLTKRDAIEDRVRELNGLRIERAQELNKQVDEVFKGPEKILSSVPQVIRESRQYVAPDDDIQRATKESIKSQIDNMMHADAPAKMRGASFANEDEIEGLKVNGRFKERYTAKELSGVRFNGTFSPTSNPGGGLLRIPAFDQCERNSRQIEHCLDNVPLDNPANDNPNGRPDNNAGGVDNGEIDIPRYVAGLFESTDHDGVVAVPLGSRPDQALIQDQVDKLQLRGGPADAPAFYDFHHLQIAFDHVWTEAFDEDVMDLLKKTYQGILDLGGAPFANHRIYEVVTAAEQACLASTQEVPAETVSATGISKPEYNALDPQQRVALEALATELQSVAGEGPSRVTVGFGAISFSETAAAWRARLRMIREGIKNLIKYARDELSAKDSAFCRLHKLVPELRSRIHDPHAFQIFAAKPGQRSVNFGLLVEYRQKWQPLNYQAGEMVATIPLAPKESRKFSKKEIVKRSRTEKEVRNNLRSHREELSDTSRAESEIVQKANTKTAFNAGTQTGANVGFNVGVVNGSFNGSFNAGFSKESAQISEEVKRDFREAIFKASQEYKSERTIEIQTDDSGEVEITRSGEISNPNDELTVTYLFYELQRRYRVSEQIHRATPVVYVAQEVPTPNEINDTWIIAHDWILRRVLLDDSFLPALNYLATRVAGDEHGLEEQRKTMELQRRLVNDIKEELVDVRDQIAGRYTALEKALSDRASMVESEDAEGFLVDVGEFIFGDDASPEAARIREDAARDAYERAMRKEKDIRSRLDREVTSLQSVTERYTKQLSEHLNRRIQIDRLKLHVKMNILYYMQSIWSYEPPDQRYFRLHQTPIPKLDGELIFNIVSDPNAPASEPLQYEAQCELDPNFETAPLAEIADLDQLLGFKGNYMIFPLKQSNCLTDFMLVPYVDAELGLKDPDDFGNWTIESFSEYICCLKKRMTPRAFEQAKLRLRKQYMTLLQSSRREFEEIIVPTGELFIEALPGAHPLLEDFKLHHRGMDVMKVVSEVRRQELENVRLAARLIDGELDDPEIDKRILIEGGNGPVVEVGDN